MSIYADHAATTAMSEAAIDAMTRCMGEEYLRSLLYHPHFSTEFRKAK